jgi:hypothetical protein
MVPALVRLVSNLSKSSGRRGRKTPVRRRWGFHSSDLPRIFAPGADSAPSSYMGGPNVRKLAILGLVLATYIVPTSSISQAKAYSDHSRYYPKGFYYRNGAWHPYRGYGHPYRRGYYDRWGHWHRYA